MEARLSALEADTRDIKAILGRLEPLIRGIDDRVRRVEIEVAEVKGRISQLPTTIQVFTHMVSLLAFTVALSGGGVGIARYFFR